MRRLLLSFGAASLVIVGFLYVLNPVRLAQQLADANILIFVFGLLAIIAALLCWSQASILLFRSAGTHLPHRRGLVAYGAGAFGKQVLPMGNAGGPAIMAYAFNREVTLGYSRSLAVVIVAEFLSLTASLILAVGGIFVLLSARSLESDLHWLGVAIALVITALLATILVVWYREHKVRLAVTGTARLFAPVVGKISRPAEERLQPERVDAAIKRYYETFRTVLGDRRAVFFALALTQLGWVLFALPLYTSAMALGVDIPLALALFIVPVAGVATVVPLPGGLGGVEVALVGLLVALTTIDLTSAGAIVILFRICSFWFFVLICGVAATMAAIAVQELITPLETSVANTGEADQTKSV